MSSEGSFTQAMGLYHFTEQCDFNEKILSFQMAIASTVFSSMYKQTALHDKVQLGLVWLG